MDSLSSCPAHFYDIVLLPCPRFGFENYNPNHYQKNKKWTRTCRSSPRTRRALLLLLKKIETVLRQAPRTSEQRRRALGLNPLLPCGLLQQGLPACVAKADRAPPSQAAAPDKLHDASGTQVADTARSVAAGYECYPLIAASAYPLPCGLVFHAAACVAEMRKYGAKQDSGGPIPSAPQLGPGLLRMHCQ